MMTLNGGPAAGKYAAKRAPAYLRAVVDRENDMRDVLDQVNDSPTVTEEISVYRRIGKAGSVHINTGRRGGTGFYALATYEWLPGVNGNRLRGAVAWEAWCAKAHCVGCGHTEDEVHAPECTHIAGEVAQP